MQQSDNTPTSQTASNNPPTQVETVLGSSQSKGAEVVVNDSPTKANGPDFWWIILPIAIVAVWLFLRSKTRSPLPGNTALPNLSTAVRAGSSVRSANDIAEHEDISAGAQSESRAAKKRERVSQAISESKKLVKQRIREKKKLKLAQTNVSASARAADQSTSAQASPQSDNPNAQPHSGARISQQPDNGHDSPGESTADWQATAAVQAAIRSSQSKKKKQSDKKPGAAVVAGFQKFDRPTTQVRQVALSEKDPWAAVERAQAVVQNEPANEFPQHSSAAETHTSNPQPRTLKDFIGSRASASGE